MSAAMSTTVDSTAAPVALRIALLAGLAVFGSALGVVGGLGWRGRLSRDGGVGVRTPHTLRCDEAFHLANRVAGPPIVVAGLVLAVGGVAAFLVPTTASTIVIAAVCLIGSLVIVRMATGMGHRAAGAVAVPAQPAPSGCGTCTVGACSVREQRTCTSG